MTPAGDLGVRGLLSWVSELHSLGTALRPGPVPGTDGYRHDGGTGPERPAGARPDRSAWAPALIRAWARIDG
ncbi:hypothetical protein FB157_13117 [Streptomyces sp. BK340]|nr:hypothetical protein FB157_13117 [Streptomyces sp. BK340]